ncbi:hypothetical protein [Botrimarina hoheduenensis]|uniref:Non-specific serine/threonine protein kinase n=1 Tax=Botrimarina hoheduenensis TaxID=2528000 RepID=A0A5C5W8R8_9BACT|nr:hypothetical protein [Botrimarina hoheduenensis]TWT47286.1 hypothetical protein Pla111_08990 [Botrimarina hoheduenensis]
MQATHSYRYALRALLLSATLTTAPNAPNADARHVFATTFYQFGNVPAGDPDPTLNGVIKIDLDTGVATPFIAEVPNQFQLLTDVAVGPHDGLVYVSSLFGTISRFNATTGAAVDTFAFFDGGVNTLRFADDGTLYAAVNNNQTGVGDIVRYDPSGVRQPDIATGLTFPSGIALDAAGEVYVATGDVGGPGQVRRIDAGAGNPLVLGSELPGSLIGGASGLTYVPAQGDYDADNDVDTDDYAAWQAAYGALGADGNADGLVDVADYTVWRDNVGQEGRLIITDFDFNSDFMGGVTGTGNELVEWGLASQSGGTFATIPIALPTVLPPPPNGWPTNFPSEALLTPERTLLVSTSGPTQRPLNNGAVLEYDLEGNLLGIIRTNLPPLTGIALVPEPILVSAIPEPTTAVIALLLLSGCVKGRTR